MTGREGPAVSSACFDRPRPDDAVSTMLRIGLISDTHGLLRPEAAAFLHGCDHIVHAGDVVGPGILEALAAIAPLTAVRGNNDHGPWAEALPLAAEVRFGNVAVQVVHDIADHVPAAAAAEGPRVVVSGHSHRPGIETRDGALYVNPGSAGPRRFRLPVTCAELEIDGDEVRARIVPLLGPPAG